MSSYWKSHESSLEAAAEKAEWERDAALAAGPPQGPRFEERTLPLCPVCDGLVRRDLGDPGVREPGPWRCDLHGEVKPSYQTLEIPAAYDEETT